MTNINCSADCIYERNGKCALTHILPFSNVTISELDCAYFDSRKKVEKTPQE